MAKTKFTFNGVNFSSKKAIDQYIRDIKNEIIEENRSQHIDNKNKHFQLFMELINLNNQKYEKIGCGVDYLYFVKGFHNEDQMRLMRLDGTNIDCSYMYSKIMTPPNKKQYLSSAMRVSIQDQIEEYRKTLPRPLVCKLCKLELGYYEIDHIKPFVSIQKEFLLLESVNVPDEYIDDSEKTCCRIFREEDEEFKIRWQIFHKKKATYQVLCETCNLKKGKKENAVCAL